MRLLILFSLAVGGIAISELTTSGLASASVPMPEQRPAVVELYTSEGCSSCPPAEGYLGVLAQRGDVLALSFHVDYWDDLGWKDRFGIPQATPRQRDYAKALHLSSVYTPQVVIDGDSDFVGSDRARIGAQLHDNRTGIPIKLSVHDGRVLVELSAQARSTSCDVMLVAFERSVISPIGRGENAGRTLTEYNVVRELRRLGRYTGEAQTYEAELLSLPRGATDVAVLVQPAALGPIVAAAQMRLEARAP